MNYAELHSANDRTGIHVLRTNPALTVLVSLYFYVFIYLFITINEYCYSAVESQHFQQHLTTEKCKTNDSEAQVKNT